MDRRQKAINELKRQIREQKARIDPRLLKIAEDAILGKPAVSEERVSALKAVEIFLQKSPALQAQLRRLMDKSSH